MKSFKNKILSVLLFTFALFIVHDYVMLDINADSKYELFSMEKDGSSLDLKSNIHDAFHTILDLNREEKLTIQLNISDTKPSILVVGLTSHINRVPQRPPLS